MTEKTLVKLLEEAVITPVDFASKLETQIKRFSKVIKRKGWVAIPAKATDETYTIGYITMDKKTGQGLATFLSIPNTDILDETITKNPEYVPVFTITSFRNEGDRWVQKKKLFPVDDARRVRKTINNVIEHALMASYDHEDNIDDGYVNLPWNRFSNTVKNVKKEKPIYIR